MQMMINFSQLPIETLPSLRDALVSLIGRFAAGPKVSSDRIGCSQ
jgi:hypothetical protein